MGGPEGLAAWAWAAALGYGLGSIPFGLVLTRLAGRGDIRATGSGNIGATNVLRSGAKALAALTLALDAAKGAAAVLAVALWGGEGGVDGGTGATALAGLAAVLGHDFPVWLRFRGGKGVATTLGVLLALAWPVGLLACATWLAVASLSRYSSLAALAALGAAPFYAQWLGGEAVGAAALLALLAIIRHHANIRRLLKGGEPRIGAKENGEGPS